MIVPSEFNRTHKAAQLLLDAGFAVRRREIAVAAELLDVKWPAFWTAAGARPPVNMAVMIAHLRVELATGVKDRELWRRRGRPVYYPHADPRRTWNE